MSETCEITGNVFDGSLASVEAARLLITPLSITDDLIHGEGIPVESEADGSIIFTVIQGGRYNIRGDVLNFTGAGLNVTIPASDEALLTSLMAVTEIPAEGLTVKASAIAFANLQGTLDFSSRFLLTESPATEINIDLAASGVTPGSYTLANITVDSFGRVTVAANGAGGSGSAAWGGITGTIGDQADLIALVGTQLTQAEADALYAAIGHNHDGAYSAIGHNHDGSYSALTHNHSGVYEPANSNIQSHISSTSNPHSVTAAQVNAAINSLVTFTGPTQARSYALPDSAATLARIDAGQTFTGINIFTSTPRLANNVALVGRNAAGSADLNLIKLTTVNQILIGTGNSDTTLIGSTAIWNGDFLQISGGTGGFMAGIYNTTKHGLAIRADDADSAVILAYYGTLEVFQVRTPGLTTATYRDSATNIVSVPLVVAHETSGTPAAGFGAGLLFQSKSSTTSGQDQGRVATEWVTATHASRTSKVTMSVVNSSQVLAQVLELLPSALNLASGVALQINGTQIVGAQGAFIADPAGGGVQDAEARTAIVAILDRLIAHGLIAAA